MHGVYVHVENIVIMTLFFVNEYLVTVIQQCM